MWKLAALASLALAFALGSVAEAKCGVCIDKVTARLLGSNTTVNTRHVELTFSGPRELADAVVPERATAVVMQVDGNRTKCIEVALARSTTESGTIVYTGGFAGSHAYHGNSQSSYEGRLDVGGAVFEFKVPLDGTPGVIKLLHVVAPPVVAPPVVAPPVVAQPVSAPGAVAPAAPVSQAVTVDEQPAPAPGLFDRISSPDGQGVLLAVAVVAFLGATLLVERRRAGRVGTESAIET